MMTHLMNYSFNKKLAHYSDGSISHRHKLDVNAIDNPLGCEQAYYTLINGRCSKCGKTLKEITEKRNPKTKVV